MTSKRGCGQGHVTPKFKSKLLFCKNSLGGDMHSHKRLLVIIKFDYALFLINENDAITLSLNGLHPFTLSTD